jgi:hypothetical protein
MNITVRLGMAALMAFALPGSGGEPTEQEDIYYSSQADADAALAQFDRDNPSCQLWTNWQKICSRTGNDSATSCLRSSYRVRPSVPFCQGHRLGSTAPDAEDRPNEFRSMQRFCAGDANRGEAAGMTGNPAACSSYATPLVPPLASIAPDTTG